MSESGRWPVVPSTVTAFPHWTATGSLCRRYVVGGVLVTHDLSKTVTKVLQEAHGLWLKDS